MSESISDRILSGPRTEYDVPFADKVKAAQWFVDTSQRLLQELKDLTWDRLSYEQKKSILNDYLMLNYFACFFGKDAVCNTCPLLGHCNFAGRRPYYWDGQNTKDEILSQMLDKAQEIDNEMLRKNMYLDVVKYQLALREFVSLAGYILKEVRMSAPLPIGYEGHDEIQGFLERGKISDFGEYKFVHITDLKRY